jgi:hypothetical protein
MNQLKVLASGVYVPLESLADLLYGCAHRNTSFPITLPIRASLEGMQSTQSETYIVCLQCARHFDYDWSRMRVGRRGDRLLPQAVPIGFPLEAPAHRGTL